MHIRCALLALLFSSLAPLAQADDWPMLHHNPARTGLTSDSPAPPFARKWLRLFVDENIDTGAEVIVAGEHAYIGTYAGKLYAMNRTDGSDAWVYDAGAMILHSPAVADAVVYLPSLRGLHALSATDGSEQWVLPVKYGFRSSPLVVDGMIYIPSRAGDVYAVKPDGSVAWKKTLATPIYTSIAYADGTLYLAGEDGCGYAIQAADGKVLWQTDPMLACTLRYYYPIVWKDRVAFFTMPTENKGRLREDGYDMLGREVGGEDTNAHSGKWKMPVQPGLQSGDDIDKESKIIRDWLIEKPGRQSLWVFDRSTGKQAYVAPILHTEGNGGGRCAGAVDEDGWLYTWGGSWYTNWHPNYPYSLERINLADGRRDVVNYSAFGRNKRHPFGYTFEYNEVYNASLGGDRLYIAHTDNAWGMNLPEMVGFTIFGNRDMLAGLYGRLNGTTILDFKGMPYARCTNEWHGTGRGAHSIADGELYWVAGGIVQCFMNKDDIETPASAPETRTDKSFPKRPPLPPAVEVNDEIVETFVSRTLPRQANPADSEVAKHAAADLNAHVEELLANFPLQPLMHVAGNGGGIWCWAHPSETFTALAQALPYLSDANRQNVIALLEAELKERSPLARECYSLAEGTPRMKDNTYASLSPDAQPFRRELQPEAADGIYGLWALAYYADRPDLAETYYKDAKTAWGQAAAEIQKLLRDKPWDMFRENPPTLSRQTQPTDLNRMIAATLGMVRLAEMTGDDTTAAQATGVLKQLLAGRANMPFVDTSYYIPFRGEPTSWYKMVPDLAATLNYLRGPAIREYYLANPTPMNTRKTKKFNRNNFWHVTHGEGLTYGETANSWPQGIAALYDIRAFVFADEPAELYRLADMPWCKGDLDYIRQLSTTLWASAGRPWSSR